MVWPTMTIKSKVNCFYNESRLQLVYYAWPESRPLVCWKEYYLEDVWYNKYNVSVNILLSNLYSSFSGSAALNTCLDLILSVFLSLTLAFQKGVEHR